jgi:hypothetical protein
MGGNVPLGYDVKDRKLIANEPEAATVRLIFRRYAELGSVALLKAELDRLGIVSKRREGAGGRLTGGQHFSRGALYLSCRTGSIGAKSLIKAQPTPASTRPSSIRSFGRSCKGILVFRKFFNGKGLYLWNSVAEDLRDGLQVSFLAELGDEVVMGWRWLGHIWDRDDPAARFPS